MSETETVLVQISKNVLEIINEEANKKKQTKSQYINLAVQENMCKDIDYAMGFKWGVIATFIFVAIVLGAITLWL